ncbi:MAG TPA: YcxB family protein [Propionibacteriaceae bacterium]|nr:YcxB family protein [Propionibacteriaceae bacterium]
MTPWIVVQLTVEDLVAFNLHMLATSRRMTQQVRSLRALMIPLLVIALAWMWVMHDLEGPDSRYAWFLLASFALLTVFLGTITRWSLPRRVRRSAASGQHPALVPMRLWVDEWGGLVVEQPDRTTWYRREALQRIEETRDHVFIHVSEMQGLVIPRRLGEPVVQPFLAALQRHRLPADGWSQGPRTEGAWRS